MDFFNKEWLEYIYNEWGDYTNWIGFFKRCDNGEKGIEIFEGNYEDKLLSEFEKYYAAKKRYIDMEQELIVRFGNYEKVEIGSYNDELIEYRERVEMYADRLHDKLLKFSREDELKGINEIDYKLLLLGYISNDNYNKLPKYCFDYEFFKRDKIFNFANVFLSGQNDYDKYLKGVIQEEAVDYYFHDCQILKVKKRGNNLSLLISSSSDVSVLPTYITFVNCVVNYDNIFHLVDREIWSNSVYYIKNKVYYYLYLFTAEMHDAKRIDVDPSKALEIEFKCDKIIINDMDEVVDIDKDLVFNGKIDKLNKEKNIGNKITKSKCLDNYDDYINYKNMIRIMDEVDEKISDYCFKEMMIYKIDKKDDELTLIIDPLYITRFAENVSEIHIKFKNIDVTEINLNELKEVIDDTKVYYINDKYYYYLEMKNGFVYQFVCDEIWIEIVRK